MTTKITDIFNRRAAVLAPLAGVSDSVYRRICRQYGAGPVMTEMISSEGYVRSHPSDKSRRLLRFQECERPIGIQFFGADPDVMAEAARRVVDIGPDFIDINAGCPVKKVISRGAGSALLLDLPRLARIVKSVADAVSIPVTVKIRSGWDHQSINAVEASRMCVDAGAQAVIVHPRPRSQLFGGLSDWSVIARVKEALTVPVIGSGDIRTAADALRMIAETGADAVMIGRGAMGNPWIFGQARELLAGEPVTPSPEMNVRLELALHHLTVLCGEVDEWFGVLNMRKFFGWYSRGMRGGAEFRQHVFKAETVAEVRNIVEEYLARGCESEEDDTALEFQDDAAVME
jgi:tRNA-dihydrouridine synthase B